MLDAASRFVDFAGAYPRVLYMVEVILGRKTQLALDLCLDEAILP